MTTLASTAATVFGGIGAVVAIAAVVVGYFYFRANGFRPKLTVEIDHRRQGIRVAVDNRGRGPGTVERAGLINNGLRSTTEYTIRGLPSGFTPTELPPKTSISLTLEAETTFAADDLVMVTYGGGKSTTKKPLPVDVGLYGVDSVLTPAATPAKKPTPKKRAQKPVATKPAAATTPVVAKPEAMQPAAKKPAAKKPAAKKKQ